jgi:hypothetical protein
MFKLTFQEYKKTYKSRLLAYLEEYEDNTPDLFLENDLKTYNAFHWTYYIYTDIILRLFK